MQWNPGLVTLPALALTVVLAGCSSSEATEQGTATAEATVSASPVTEAATAVSASADDVVPVGDWAHYESTTYSLDVRVTDTSCGQTTLEDAVMNEDWDGMDMEEAFVDAESAQGEVFCVVTYDAKNVGTDPVEFPYPPADLTTDSGKSYMPSLDDEMVADTLLAHQNGEDFVSYPPLNPDDVQERIFVAQIPEGAEPVSLTYPNESRVQSTTMEQIDFAL